MNLFPRITVSRSGRLISERASLPVRELENIATTSDPYAIYGATGGSRVTIAALETLSNKLGDLVRSCGYPDDSSRSAFDRFDSEAPGLLYTEMAISASEAARPEVWSFVGCVMAPHVVRWRFPGGQAGTSQDRFAATRGIVRNTFGRLWWRAHLLKDRSDDNPWHLLNTLGEDELVQITERPSIAGYPELAVALAKTLVEVHSQASNPPARSELIRELMKWITRYRSIVLFESLSNDELYPVVASAAKHALFAMTGGSEGEQELKAVVATLETGDTTESVPEDTGQRSLQSYLKTIGMDLRDRLELSGNLWVIGDLSLEPIMKKLTESGVHFDFRPEGGRGTAYRPSWLFRGLDEDSSFSLDTN